MLRILVTCDEATGQEIAERIPCEDREELRDWVADRLASVGVAFYEAEAERVTRSLEAGQGCVVWAADLGEPDLHLRVEMG